MAITFTPTPKKDLSEVSGNNTAVTQEIKNKIKELEETIKNQGTSIETINSELDAFVDGGLNE